MRHLHLIHTTDLKEGGPGPDTLPGTDNRDTMFGYGGDDLIYGGLGDDDIYGGEGTDTAYGGGGNDYIIVGNGAPDDPVADCKAVGGTGNDTIRGDDGNDYLYGSSGRDSIDGYTGNDHIYGGSGDDIISGNIGFASRLSGGTGHDTLQWFSETGTHFDLGAASYALPTGRGNTLISSFENLESGTGNDSIRGADVRNNIFSGAGDDIIKGLGKSDVLDGFLGVDTIYGGTGNDVINNRISTFIQNDGGDQLYGGTGYDKFVFTKAWQSPADDPDVILDFKHGVDHIDLRVFFGSFGLTSLTFIEDAAFTAANQVRFADGRLEVNVTGSLAADLAITLTGVTLFDAGDLFL